MTKPEPTLFAQLIDATKKQLDSPGRSFFITKVVGIFGIYVFLVMNSLYDYVSPDYVPECVTDKVHDATLPITIYLAQNPIFRNLLIIVASLMMDITVFILSVREIFTSKSYRLFYTVLLFYVFRGFLQSVFFLKFPTDYIWGHPGIFSLTVPYAPANDFFYSGHVGLCTICYLNFRRAGQKKLQLFALATIAVEFFTLLVTRAHYFIDLVFGFIVAHYIYLCIEWVYEYLDEREKNKKIPCTVEEQSLDSSSQEEDKPIMNGKSKEQEINRSM